MGQPSATIAFSTEDKSSFFSQINGSPGKFIRLSMPRQVCITDIDLGVSKRAVLELPDPEVDGELQNV